MAHTYDDETFRSYRLWLLKMASVYLPKRPGEWDDLAQEGHIAMWKASQTYDPSKGSLPTWLTNAAKMRMRDCAYRFTWTGTPMIRGHKREKPADPVEADALANQAFVMHESVEMAYHQGEVYQALSGLSQSVREALFNRFWLDKPVANGLYYKAMPDLQKNLEHLKGTCD